MILEEKEQVSKRGCDKVCEKTGKLQYLILSCKKIRSDKKTEYSSGQKIAAKNIKATT
jgi:hypothetical protein